MPVKGVKCVPQLTLSELWFLDECVKGEALIARKLGVLGNQANDPQLRSLCQTLQQNHQRRLDILANHIVS
jgi:hypothetical protein